MPKKTKAYTVLCDIKENVFFIDPSTRFEIIYKKMRDNQAIAVCYRDGTNKQLEGGAVSHWVEDFGGAEEVTEFSTDLFDLLSFRPAH
jgi:hypothetical protein|tara:strand:+ start:5026 stop:5289 length:264 start_codon:yes stop_codon:yes gene_type:complete